MGSGGRYLLPIKLLILHVISDSPLGCSGDGKGNGAQFDGGQDQRGANRHAGYGLARGNALAHPIPDQGGLKKLRSPSAMKRTSSPLMIDWPTGRTKLTPLRTPPIWRLGWSSVAMLPAAVGAGVGAKSLEPTDMSMIDQN